MKTLIVNSDKLHKEFSMWYPSLGSEVVIPTKEIRSLFLKTIDTDLSEIKNGRLTNKPTYEWHKSEGCISILDDAKMVESNRKLFIKQGFEFAGTREIKFEKHRLIAHAYHN